MSYQPAIGLEIHVELKTKSKMFCSCLNDPDEKQPNVNICPVCTAQPGTLPVINEEALRKVIKTGLALNCQISKHSQFDRKNYFYPDLPKGYQISQLYRPLCKNGYLEIGGKKVRIREIHLEEDTGKLIHPEGADYSLVDFNRAGIPLMELVTEPDLASAQEARAFAQELHLIMHYLDVSDADMEKGQMRVEVNISLSSGSKLGTKVEIKNLNYFRSGERGVNFEIERQEKLLRAGKKVIQETRGWHDVKEITFSQRAKEEAHDYRYFPEPDLPPLHLAKILVDGIRAEMPELPQKRRARLRREYGIEENNVEILIYHKDLGEYFEKIISEFPARLAPEKLLRLVKLAANYLISDLQGLLKGSSIKDKNFLISPDNFADFIGLIERGDISSKIAKVVLEEMLKSGADPSHIIREKGLAQITNEKEIEQAVQEVIAKNPKAIEDYKNGKQNALQFLIGQAMAQTRGKADPAILTKIIRSAII